MTPMIASAATYGAAFRDASGKSGRQNRIMPYVPIFRSTPARMTEPAVGASTCASGSHVCNGNSGTLIAKATKKARNNSISVCGIRTRLPACSTRWISTRSNVPVALYSHRMPTSIKIEPAIV